MTLLSTYTHIRTRITLLLIMTLLGVVASTLPTQAQTGTLPPLSVDQYTCVSDSCSRTMQTQASLYRSGNLAGRLQALTRTRNTVLMTGYTGGVYILLRRSDGAVIGVSGLHTFGVDGKWIGRYDRTDFWQEQFDPRVAAATTQIQVIQQHVPKERLSATLAQIADYKRQACQIFPVPGC